MEQIKAIETIYNGYRFRSRLEARWAVFFDALGVDYEYEPEGFDLGDGIYYLPDFRVMCHGKRGACDEDAWPLYIEVKGVMTEDDARKIKKFAERMPILVVGGIPQWVDEAWLNNDMGCDVHALNYQTIDGDYFGAFPTADKRGRFYLMGADSNYMDSEGVERAESACQSARQARFEHGEMPA